MHAPSFVYTLDEDSTGHSEYARFPVETLVDKTGDCECFSILLAAFLKAHGHKTALVYTNGHCMAGVEIPGEIELPGLWVTDGEGVRYFLCEATGSGWQVGQPASDDPVERVEPV